MSGASSLNREATMGTGFIFWFFRRPRMSPEPGTLVDVRWTNHAPSGDHNASAIAHSSSSSSTGSLLPSLRFVHRSNEDPARSDANVTDSPSGVQIDRD